MTFLLTDWGAGQTANWLNPWKQGREIMAGVGPTDMMIKEMFESLLNLRLNFLSFFLIHYSITNLFILYLLYYTV